MWKAVTGTVESLGMKGAATERAQDRVTVLLATRVFHF